MPYKYALHKLGHIPATIVHIPQVQPSLGACPAVTKIHELCLDVGTVSLKTMSSTLGLSDDVVSLVFI